MNTLPTSSAAVPEHDRLPRGVHSELFHGHRVYFGVKSDGSLLPGIRVPIGQETEDDVIEALADDLDRDDPLPRPASPRPVLRIVVGALPLCHA